MVFQNKMNVTWIMPFCLLANCRTPLFFPFKNNHIQIFPPSTTNGTSPLAVPFGSPTSPNKPHAQIVMPPVIRLDAHTWQIPLPHKQIFHATVGFISKSYVVKSLEEQLKTSFLQTDWDHFTLQGGLFRNRLSIRFFNRSPQKCDVTISNRLETSVHETNSPFSQWIPTPDITDEVAKILEFVEQTALLYSQRAPHYPPSQPTHPLSWGETNRAFSEFGLR